MTIDEVGVARRAAQAAADVLLDLRAGGELTGRALGDAGDAAAQQAIVASLTGLEQSLRSTEQDNTTTDETQSAAFARSQHRLG